MTVLWVPFTTALTFLMLGFLVLLVLRLEWETLFPNVTPFPQYIHFARSCTSLDFLDYLKQTEIILHL